MPISHSPLRYPGGKQILARVLSHLMKENGVHGGTYIEPYAGGAGAALSLLFGEHVERIMINDADPCVHAFWSSILQQTEQFVQLIRTTALSVEEWARQRRIYQRPTKYSPLKVGFSTFYLNRCNRSGIIANGGPIGGKSQSGIWKIDARFNRDDLVRRIVKISLYRDRIDLSKLDAIEFLECNVPATGRGALPFVYLDPPYYAKGRDLYLNHYRPDDHARLAAYLKRKARFLWVLSYDDVPEIRRLYSNLRQVPFDLKYSARTRRIGREILILRQNLVFPREWRSRIPKEVVTAADRLHCALPS